METLFITLSDAMSGAPLLALLAAFAWGVLSIVLSRRWSKFSEPARGEYTRIVITLRECFDQRRPVTRGYAGRGGRQRGLSWARF